MTTNADATPSMLPAARWYSNQGIAVIPLWWPNGNQCACPAGADCHSPAKHPLTPNGLNDATTDDDKIREWWSRWPAANIGLPTGLTFDVVDIDGAAGAWAAKYASRISRGALGSSGCM